MSKMLTTARPMPDGAVLDVGFIVDYLDLSHAHIGPCIASWLMDDMIWLTELTSGGIETAIYLINKNAGPKGKK